MCTYQPDTLTIRASFSVPGRGAAAVSPDWEESDRSGRQRKFRMVGKSSLVLKEDYNDDSGPMDVKSTAESVSIQSDGQIPKKHLEVTGSAENIDSNQISSASDSVRDAKYARLMQQIDQEAKRKNSYCKLETETSQIIRIYFV